MRRALKMTKGKAKFKIIEAGQKEDGGGTAAEEGTAAAGGLAAPAPGSGAQGRASTVCTIICTGAGVRSGEHWSHC